MTYLVKWGAGKSREVSSARELDALLSEIVKPGDLRVVGIYPPREEDDDASPWDDPSPGGLEIGVGHPSRSFVFWYGEGGGAGYQSELPPWPADTAEILFDYFGDPIFCDAERARVTPEAAHQAAREYVETGQRPTCVEWGA